MGLIFTNEAMCRDCYRCVRSCPVKSIQIKSTEKEQVHARVIDEYCILDARCVSSCPQNAKVIKSDLEKVKKLLEKGVPVAASIAPSFAAALPLDDPEMLPAILKRLGFELVQETAVGAELVAGEHRRGGQIKHVIDSSCPVIVNLVEKHFPNLTPWLSTLVSPMIAHGRYIKSNYNNIPVVFIGPCVAKKEESTGQEVKDAVDFVLGFDELWAWIKETKLNLDSLQPSSFDGPHPALARLFPVEGGILKAAAPDIDKLEMEVGSITGLDNCIKYLKHLSAGKINHPPRLMEMLACSGGCIGGPRCVTGDDPFVRRQKIIRYYKSHPETQYHPETDIYLESRLLRRQYTNKKSMREMPDERTIKKILAQTGKYRPEDELNCGACGYDSCRDKAIAVYRGMAEVQMCCPYMRKRAESMTKVILNSMPNSALVVDNDLRILEINPKAEEMFNCRAAEITGRPLDCIIDSGNFRKAVAKKQLIDVLTHYRDYHIVTREIIIPLDREQIIIGIFIDITEEQHHKEQIDQMKTQTIARAREVIEKQMKVAQEIAGLLGETTAETKVLLTKLIKLMQDSPVSGERGPDKR